MIELILNGKIWFSATREKWDLGDEIKSNDKESQFIFLHTGVHDFMSKCIFYTMFTLKAAYLHPCDVRYPINGFCSSLFFCS